MPPLARALVGLLLDPSPDTRLGGGDGGLRAVTAHAFFEGLDGDRLYAEAPPPLAGGAAAPAPHAKWTRRQNSMLWSPLPQRYSFGEEGNELPAIPEKGEAAARFTRSLGSLVERGPCAGEAAPAVPMEM
jgi:hypothetical protein